MEYPLTEKEFREIYAKVPRLCVDLVLRDEGKVLLSKRLIEPYKDLWHLPGGTVYFGETIKAAVKRVARQELGVEVKIDELLGYIEFPDEYKDHWHGWPVSLCFAVKVVSGQIRGSQQAEEIGFFSKLPPNMVQPHQEFLEK